MSDAILVFWELITKGDSNSVLSLLFFVLTLVLSFIVYIDRKEMKEMHKELVNSKNSHIHDMEKMMERFVGVNTKLSQALGEIRIVLATMQRLSK